MKNLLIAILFFVAANASAQQQMSVDTNAVKSINGILKEMLRLISGEKGKTRNFDAFKNLFLPTADFMVLNHSDSAEQPLESASLAEFIELMHDPYYEKGYLEFELGKVVNEYNGIANVFQGFYGKDSDNMKERGINSYQLVYFNKRWWIAHVLWTLESKSIKIPAKYLNKSRSGN
jgi:hypothetical protein